MEISELDLPVYVCRALYDREINTVEELCKKSEGDLMKVWLLGVKGIARIKEQLSIRGLKLLFEYPPTPPRRHRRDKDHRRATDRQTTMRLTVHPHEAWIDQKDYQSIVLRIPCKMMGLDLIHATNAALAAAKKAVQSSIDKEGA